MATKSKTKNYTVNAKIITIASIEIVANSLDEALEKAKQLDSPDFVEVLGENLDGEYHLLGISDSDNWL